MLQSFVVKKMLLTHSDFRTDKSVRKRRPAVNFVRIYPYMDFGIDIWGFDRRPTNTLCYHTRGVHVLPVSSWQPFCSMFTKREESAVYSKLSAVFGEFWKIVIVGPTSIHRLAWNTTANYMDFLP